MVNLKTVLDTLFAHKQQVGNKYGLSNLAIFCSYARKQQTDESDLGILVEFNRPKEKRKLHWPVTDVHPQRHGQTQIP
jgi:predicted nucleotidyltransferase